MIVVIIIILALGWGYWTQVYNSPNAKLVRSLTKDKNEEQTKTIEYFLKKGCMTKTITDEEYLAMVRAKRDSMNYRQKALSKIGLDEEEVSEIPPAHFEGFVFDKAYAKQNASGQWVSSSYQVSWLFFSSTQIYIYRSTFNMDDDMKKESTDEFFYKDVTSFSTSSVNETAHGISEKSEKQVDVEVESNKFKMVVPGDQIFVSMDGIENSEQIIQAMKQKLREKKNL